MTQEPARPVVVVPALRDRLAPDERTALRHLEAHLGRYPRIVIHPASVAIRWPGFETRSFADEHFASRDTYSKLLLSRPFYESFGRFTHILIHQLDALVFSDQLLEWCSRNIDYVGAPWPRDARRPELGLSHAGNGGLSLRRVSAFLDVLSRDGAVHRLRAALRACARPALLPDLSRLPVRERLAKRMALARLSLRGVGRFTSGYTLNEDRFWSDRARLFASDFRIPPAREALRFAFEVAPRSCYAWNDHRLPFGCHAWAMWDRAFWEPFLSRDV